ncbi:Protein ccc1 [Naganishia albida]|nr:Protein ccc1 [Naganishia albida]
MSCKHTPAAPMSKQQCCSTTGNCPCASTSKSNRVDPATASANETVRLPKSKKNGHASIANEGVWKVTDERTSLIAQNGARGGDYGSRSRENSPAPSIFDKCDAAPGSTCCRDAVPEERHLISHDIVRDIIIGLSDGLTVPFALTAGLSSLGSSKLVYMGGLAEIVGGAFSMGVGGYLAAQAEQDLFRHKFSEYTRRLEIACGSEVDREVHEVLAPLGVTEDVSRAVSNSLVQAALADEVASFSSSDSRALFGHRFSWMNRASKRPVPTKGTTAFLLKFGLGMEEVPSSRLFASAFTIGASYALGGLVPLVPYFFIDRAYVALYWSIGITSIILLLFGGLKAWFTGAALGPGGIVWGAVSTTLVVAAAGAASFGIVRVLEN